MTIYFNGYRPPEPKPYRPLVELGEHIKFIAAHCNSSKFYISCDDDEPETLQVRLT